MPSVRELEDMKIGSFDPILARIVATRVIYYQRVRTREKYEPLINALMPVVKNRVNPSVIKAITKGQSDFEAHSWTSRRESFYMPEDDVRLELRKLIVYYHGPSDHRFIRRLTETCLHIVASIINSENVSGELRTASRKALAA